MTTLHNLSITRPAFIYQIEILTICNFGSHYRQLFVNLFPKSVDWFSWWRHQMETFSALLAICAGNSPVPGEFPTQKPVTRSFDVFFDLRLNKRLSKQSWGWWFETLSRPLWRHRNVKWNGFADQSCLRSPLGREYMGTVNVSQSGSICMPWSDVELQMYGPGPVWLFLDDTIGEAQNYCRNPDGDPRGPWCYTENEGVKDYCNVPRCGEWRFHSRSGGYWSSVR